MSAVPAAVPVLGGLWQWVLRGSLNSPDFFGPTLFPGHATYAPADVRYLGLALALGAALWALRNWLDRPGFWGGVILLAVLIRAVGTAASVLGAGRHGEPTVLATIAAGPVAGVYLWSILIYALFRTLRAGSRGSVAGRPAMMRVSWGLGTGVLTALLVLVVPAALYWASARGMQVTGSMWSLAAEYNPPVYTLLALGYGTLHRRTRDGRFRYLAWILGLSAIGGWSHWLARVPLSEMLLPRHWPSALVVLALVQALLWFPASGGCRGRRAWRI